MLRGPSALQEGVGSSSGPRSCLFMPNSMLYRPPTPELRVRRMFWGCGAFGGPVCLPAPVPLPGSAPSTQVRLLSALAALGPPPFGGNVPFVSSPPCNDGKIIFQIVSLESREPGAQLTGPGASHMATLCFVLSDRSSVFYSCNPRGGSGRGGRAGSVTCLWMGRLRPGGFLEGILPGARPRSPALLLLGKTVKPKSTHP